MCDFNGTVNTCTDIHDTNGNLVQNGQVFVPGTIKYNQYRRGGDGYAIPREHHSRFAIQ